MKGGAAVRVAAALAALAAAGCRAAPVPAGGAAGGGAAAVAGAQPLRSPFDVEERRRMAGAALPAPSPPVAVAPVRDLHGVSFYIDDSKSVADPELKAQNLEALRPVRTFVREVEELADGWMVSQPANPAYARLGLQALHAWAEADALLGDVNRQGEYEREWTLGSLALAYLKLREAPGLDARQLARVESWLAALAEVVRPYYERMGLQSNLNNHAYWTGLAVAATGVACQDRELFAWGLSRARIGIGQVEEDGVLPLELGRDGLALHYHVFALAPLVMLAELATVNGVALYDERGGAIRRLADRVTAGLEDPGQFERLTGHRQTQITRPPVKTDLAWAEPYYARFRDRRLAGWIAAARPLRDPRLGGDLTAAFGAAGL